MGLKTKGLLPPEEASVWPLDENVRAYLEQTTQSYIEGDPDQVKEGILSSSERYQTPDIGIVSNCYYFDDRKKSYRLVAESMDVHPNSIPDVATAEF